MGCYMPCTIYIKHLDARLFMFGDGSLIMMITPGNGVDSALSSEHLLLAIGWADSPYLIVLVSKTPWYC